MTSWSAMVLIGKWDNVIIKYNILKDIMEGGFGWNTYDNIFISNKVLKYVSEDLNGEFTNTIRNPVSNSFTIQITDAKAKFF